MSRRRFATVVAGATALLLCCAVPVQAALLTLSTHASDGNLPDASQLDATFEFSIESGQLLLTVSNLTPEGPLDPALNIDEIYFNAKDNITNLNLAGVSAGNTNKWVWDFFQQEDGDGDGNPHQVNGFGKFDMYVKDTTALPKTYINSQDSLTFTFNITGTDPVDTDFIELSAQVDGHIISYAAAKFYDGDGISGFGATNVPEPATIALLGFGALVLLRKRKRA
jgi:hypothetical protein